MSYLLYNLIGILFRAGLKPFYEVVIEGMDNYSESPSSLIVANHKRDLDSILIASAFFYKDGFFNPGHPVSFMAADNLFQPGFLASWIQKPKIFKKLMRPVSIGWILKLLHAYPIGKLDFHSTPLHDALRIIEEKEGDHGLGEILKEEKLEEILDKSAGKDVPSIKEFFESEGYPRERINSRAFKKKYRKVVKKEKLGSVKGQLESFIDLMDRGEILYITPEGKLSSDGLLGSLKDSLHVLIEEPRRGVTVVPTNITYDFMTSGKATVTVNVGEELAGLAEMGRKDRGQKIRETILSLTTITLSQLGSRQLVEAAEKDRVEISRKEILEGARECLKKVSREGLNLEGNLRNSDSFKRRFEGFLDYCLNRGVLTEKEGEGFYLDPELGYRKDTANRGYRRDPVRYTANELKGLEQVGLVDLA